MAYAAPYPVLVQRAAVPVRAGVWNTRWDDCSGEPGGCGRCCSVSCCLPCSFGKLAGSLPRDNGACCAGNEAGACILHGLVSAPVYGVGVYFFCCFAVGLVPVVGALTSLLHTSVRRGLKRHHGIADEPGCAGADIPLAVCCEPCITCQELREVDLRAYGQAYGQGGIAMAVMPTMFVPPGGMVMNPMQGQGGQHPQHPQQYAQQPQFVQPQYAQQPVYGMQQAQQQQPVQPQQTFYTATVQPMAAPPPAYGQPAGGAGGAGGSGEAPYYAK